MLRGHPPIYHAAGGCYSVVGLLAFHHLFRSVHINKILLSPFTEKGTLCCEESQHFPSLSQGNGLWRVLKDLLDKFDQLFNL